MTNVFIVSAPSGSGKSTLLRGVFESDRDLVFSISYTTRPPRGKETDGRDYFFITREEFELEIAHGAFLESAEVFGNYYGTHRRFHDEAAAAGKDLVLDIDVQGARQLRSRVPRRGQHLHIAPLSRRTGEAVAGPFGRFRRSDRAPVAGGRRRNPALPRVQLRDCEWRCRGSDWGFGCHLQSGTAPSN